MSEIVVAALKIAFLAVLWLFILFAANIIRTDLFGRRVATAEVAAVTQSRPRRTKQPKLPKDVPTQLRVTQGTQSGTVIPLQGMVGIGRASDSTFNIDDEFSSTRHATITSDSDGRWWITDLGSTNGTSLNAKPLTEPQLLKVGDTIRIGRTHLKAER